MKKKQAISIFKLWQIVLLFFSVKNIAEVVQWPCPGPNRVYLHFHRTHLWCVCVSEDTPEPNPKSCFISLRNKLPGSTAQPRVAFPVVVALLDTEGQVFPSLAVFIRTLNLPQHFRSILCPESSGSGGFMETGEGWWIAMIDLELKLEYLWGEIQEGE